MKKETPQGNDSSTYSSQKEKLLQAYSDWLRMRNYSEQTYKSYMGSVRNFWRYCETKKGDNFFDKSNAVQSYLAYRMHDQKRDFSTVNGDYSALQWFYKNILNRAWNTQKLVRPKREKRLARYISPQQFSDLLTATPCPKRRLMMMLYYATGLRLSEARLLKWEHINFEEGIILVERGKGAKDRIAILPSNLAVQFQVYRQTLRSGQVYIFEGQAIGKPIAASTVQWGFKQARRKAGLPTWVTAHVLRHSYATACLKNGTDLLSLKMLLGHKQITTTSGYLHLNVAHFKRTYNPLSEPCFSQYLQSPLLAPPSPPIQQKNLDNSLSDKSSDNLEQSTSKDTNPTIGNEQS